MRSLPMLLAAAALAGLSPLPHVAARQAAPAQAAARGATLPDTPAGRHAAAFLAMVNDGGPDAVRAFERDHRSAKQQAAVSVDERIERIANLKKEWGGVTVVEVLEAGDSGVTLIARTAGGQPLTMEFAYDAAGRIDGVTISDSEVRPVPLTAQARAATVEAACRALEEGYVFPEKAAKMAALARENLKSGAYGTIASENALARRLTDDFRSITHDMHLGVRVEPERTEEPGQRMDAHAMERENFAFRKAEVLPGNIGYLRFDMFAEGPGPQDTASAAMNFLAHCDALIFDMRFNGGGSPEQIRYITSYLFEEPTHLNDMIDREGKTVETYWTLKEVPGARPRKDIPVYVLTSGRTFSGAEEFTYNLKNLKRATVIGQTTGGGAHPVNMVRLSERFVIGVPYMRANNPISKTNWEGTGVEPDIKVPAGEALDRAVDEARAKIGAK